MPDLAQVLKQIEAAFGGERAISDPPYQPIRLPVSAARQREPRPPQMTRAEYLTQRRAYRKAMRGAEEARIRSSYCDAISSLSSQPIGPKVPRIHPRLIEPRLAVGTPFNALRQARERLAWALSEYRDDKRKNWKSAVPRREWFRALDGVL